MRDRRRTHESWGLVECAILRGIIVCAFASVASADDGSWSRAQVSPRFGHAAIIDPLRDKLVVFGGNEGLFVLRNDTWSISLSDPPPWNEIVPTGAPPAIRHAHTAVHDPVRDRFIVFGGHDGNAPRNDLWALSLGPSPAWTPLFPSGTSPPPRYGHTAIYDPVRDEVIVIGGFADSASIDVWALSLSDLSWRSIAPGGAPPTGRLEHSAVYDAPRDRIIVYAGHRAFVPFTDVWTLTLGENPTWSPLNAAGPLPGARYSHTAIFDPVRDTMIIFGGSPTRNDVWELALGGTPAWTAITPTGTPPAPRAECSASLDAVEHRMIVFGGTGPHADLWQLTLDGTPAWSQLPPNDTRPPRRWRHTAIYDPLRDRMIIHGGDATTFGGGQRYYDVWARALDGTGWEQLIPLGIEPPGTFGHTAIYDPIRDRMIRYGGSLGGNGVWALDLDDIEWSQLPVTGTSPPARSTHSAVYDAGQDRMIVFGGNSDPSLNDVWALSLSGTPTWTEIVPAGTESARFGHGAIYDAASQRMIVFGGHDGSDRNDLWSLSLDANPTWTLLSPAGDAPLGRSWPSVIVETERNRMIMFGGGRGFSARNDVWSFDLVGPPAWSQLVPDGGPPSQRRGHSAIYDPVRSTMVVFAGDLSVGLLDDTWHLTWLAATLVEPPAIPDHAGLELVSYPNPSSARSAMRFRLDRTERVRLTVYDAQGRRVRSLVEPESFAAGEHTVVWDGRDALGRAAPSGVFFARLEAGDAIASRKILLFR